jgi:phosphoribosylaminoimidazole-succinocarboxamide synthase
MTREAVAAALPAAVDHLPESAAAGRPVYHGKVRDVVKGDHTLLLVASDRISAYDRVLATVPFKGEVLSRISAWWFERCSDIIPNHIVQGGDPLSLGLGRATLARKAEMLSVEVVVRGYLAGSAWRDYKAGRDISGIRLPPGLSRNERFPSPLITPSTKEEGGHDQPISSERVVASGLVEADVWAQVERAALALFRRGQELAAQVGLILVDTKYEFGLVDGKLVLADELHSPDSSRYWWADSYASLFRSHEDQRELDKEPFRRWLAERGYTGDGLPPLIPDDLRIETSLRYIRAFETITGQAFSSISPAGRSELEAIQRIIREKLS